jgi:predicted aconitase with swiveling domain
MALTARILFPGRADGELLKLTDPLSLWGGVDPDTGEIIDVRHPQRGAYIGGKVVAIPRMIGSSSSSAVMLELIRNGRAPRALILGNVDAILIVGCLVGRELGYACPPVLQLDPARIERLTGGLFRIEAEESAAGEGVLTAVGQAR